MIERDATPPAVETDMAQRCDAISRVAPILDRHFPLVELLIDLPKVANGGAGNARRAGSNPSAEVTADGPRLSEGQ